MEPARHRRRPRLAGVALLLVGVTAGCGSTRDVDPPALAEVSPTSDPDGSSTSPPGDPDTDADADADTDVEPEPETTVPAPTEVRGTVVSAVDGTPLDGAVLTVDGEPVAVTGPDGGFAVTPEPGAVLTVRLPTWLPVTLDATPAVEPVAVELEPVVARGVRVGREVAADAERFADLLDLVAGTTVNALVFDTKDETGTVLYDTGVPEAARLGSITPVYDPGTLLGLAAERGLYPITRVVTFEDRVWAGADPEAKLAGAWVDAGDEANWDYPIGLAEEACRLGFAEIQFDYVRFPAGRTAQAAASLIPPTPDERAEVIATFLGRARERLAPLGCGVSAAIFGIVMSSETDEGIGQTVEAVGPQVDALSPMLYPSHYGPGWLGFADPNDHPGPVVADALDDGTPRAPASIQMRPWIQAFYYNGQQIGAQIAEAEARGAGWLLWNASGNYRADWLPSAS